MPRPDIVDVKYLGTVLEGERIRQIYEVINPDKLYWLGKQMA